MLEPLFAEARALTGAARERLADEAEAARAAHVAAVASAQERLVAHLASQLEGRVLAAAREGRSEAELLAFEGGDAFEDTGLVLLYLLKGPRQAERGVRALLPALRRAFAPFTVRHVWRAGTTHNSVVVSWADGAAAADDAC